MPKHWLRRLANRRRIDLIRVQPDDSALYRRLYDEDVLRHSCLYNVGAGDFRHPYWTNIDHPSWAYAAQQKRGVDIPWDLMRLEPLPIEDGSAAAVYTSHTLEHVSDEAARNFFIEAHRILRPGGVLRVTTPNVDLAYRAYRSGDREYFYWAAMYADPATARRTGARMPLTDASIQQLFLFHVAANAATLHANASDQALTDEDIDKVFETMPYTEALDHCVGRVSAEVQGRNPHNHCNWWNPDKMQAMMRAAGFDPYCSAYGQSVCPVLRNTFYFDSTHPKNSLYAEAIKNASAEDVWQGT